MTKKLFATFLLCAALAFAQYPPAYNYDGGYASGESWNMVAATNALRTLHGATVLQQDQYLHSYALWHVLDMLYNSTCSQINSYGDTASVTVLMMGYSGPETINEIVGCIGPETGTAAAMLSYFHANNTNIWNDLTQTRSGSQYHAIGATVGCDVNYQWRCVWSIVVAGHVQTGLNVPSGEGNAPSLNSYSVSPSSFDNPSNPIQLSWSTWFPARMSVIEYGSAGLIIEAAGYDTILVQPSGTTAYHLAAANSGPSAIVTGTATYTADYLVSPTITSFTQDWPTGVVSPGTPVSLHWTTTGAITSGVIDQGVGSVNYYSGYKTVYPQATTTYTATFCNPHPGCANRQVTVTVR